MAVPFIDLCSPPNIIGFRSKRTTIVKIRISVKSTIDLHIKRSASQDLYEIEMFRFTVLYSN